MPVIVISKTALYKDGRRDYAVVFVRGDGVESDLEVFKKLPDAVRFAVKEAEKRNIKSITNRVFPFAYDFKKLKVN
jgi:hypothetical protein